MIQPTTSRHCNFCNLTPDEAEDVNKMALIFLDIDGVMIPCSHVDLTKVLKRKFGKVKKGQEYSYFQQRAARAEFLSESCVNNLMDLIKKVESCVKKVGIVISSAWGHDGTTKQVCCKMFQGHPFSQYIIGRTCSQDGWDPEWKRINKNKALKQKMRLFEQQIEERDGYFRWTRTEEIRHWIQEHNAQNYVIFDDGDFGLPESFGARFIGIGSLLSPGDIQLAEDVLSSKIPSHSLDESEKFHQLKSVTIKDASTSDQVITTILKSTDLEDFTLNGDKEVTKLYNATGFRKFEVKRCPQLKEIRNVECRQMTVEKCQQLLIIDEGTLKGVEAVWITQCGNIQSLGNMPSVKEGRIFNNNSLSVIGDLMSVEKLWINDRGPSLMAMPFVNTLYLYENNNLKKVGAIGHKTDLFNPSYTHVQVKGRREDDPEVVTFCETIIEANRGGPLPMIPYSVSTQEQYEPEYYRNQLKEYAKVCSQLKLEWTRLIKVPQEIGLLTSLTSFHISGRTVWRLSDQVSCLTNLQEMTLLNNSFAQLPRTLSSLSHLETLTISDNRDLGYKMLSLPTSLIVLTLSNNKMSEAPSCLSSLTNLTALDLSGNQLKELPPGFSQLSQLRQLSLAYNRLTKLPDELSTLSQLKKSEIKLSGNPDLK